MWYPITSQQATPIAPPKAMPTCTSIYRCHACLDFRRVLPICRKSGHVSTTLTNELQHMLLWMVGRRIGSAITQSRKTKIVCAHVYFWREFSPLLGNSCADDYPPTEKPVEGNDTWIQEEKWEQLLLQISNSAGTLLRVRTYKKMCGRGFGCGNWRGLVRCDWISHHIPIAFSFPEILHATRVSTNTVLIQSLMHLRVWKIIVKVPNQKVTRWPKSSSSSSDRLVQNYVTLSWWILRIIAAF